MIHRFLENRMRRPRLRLIHHESQSRNPFNNGKKQENKKIDMAVGFRGLLVWLISNSYAVINANIIVRIPRASPVLWIFEDAAKNIIMTAIIPVPSPMIRFAVTGSPVVSELIMNSNITALLNADGEDGLLVLV